MNIGAPELVIIVLIAAAFGIPIWALIDAAIRPVDVWEAAGKSKTGWVVALAVLTPLNIFFAGTILGIVYLASVRSRLLYQEYLRSTEAPPPPPAPPQT